MDRRRFLASTSGMGMALALGPAFWNRAFAAPAQPGPSPYGELLAADANGVQLPAGFTSRIIARANTPVAGTAYPWHVFSDGGACIAAEDGGWYYISNSENPPPVDVALPPGFTEAHSAVLATLGGVSVIRFDAEGNIVEAFRLLSGTRSNCSGGVTPWGTWLSCEEFEVPSSAGAAYAGGRVFECDPVARTAIARPALGAFPHEMAAVDDARHQVYLSEDKPDGLLYRFTAPPGVWGSGAALEGGTLDAMAVAGDGTVTWLPVPNAAAPTAPLRESVPGATPFDGGEGLALDSDRVYLTTKNDNRVWVHDIAAQTMAVLYDGAEFPSPTLEGVDNIIVSKARDLYVAEDGGNMEINIITPDLVVAPVVRLPGQEHGFDNGTSVPTVSEVSGISFSPDGNRLYLVSSRAFVFGVVYEVTGPFRGGSLAAAAQAPSGPSAPGPATTAAPTPAPTPLGGVLARTGSGSALGWAGAAAAAGAAALVRLRSRTGPSRPSS